MKLVYENIMLNLDCLAKILTQHQMEGRCMVGWTNLGVTPTNFALWVPIAMPMWLYRFKNLLKWTWFKDLNLNIYMMHKIMLQFFLNHKSHGLLNSKLMDYTSNYHFYVDYAKVH
jgi:hypothetical protein